MASPLGFPAQEPGVAIRVGGWATDEDFPVYPVGSKPKRMLICPTSSAQQPCLIPGHSYLFKTAIGWQQQQVWSEVIAYRIASLIGLDVPPCFIAIDQDAGTVGALVEFFFGYPNETSPARLIHGSDLLTQTFTDKKRGRPHYLRRNFRIARSLKVPNAVQWWARVLAFDALIGNTDRHPENWGFLVRRDSTGQPTFEMAPAFDNGTSLAYELPEKSLHEMCEESRVAGYIAKGKHHCEWDESEGTPGQHVALCARLTSAYPEAGAVMQDVIRFDVEQVAAIAEDCTRFAVGIKFTLERATLVSKLVRARQAQLSAALGG